MSDWQSVSILTRTDDDGTTYKIEHEGITVVVRFHADGTIRLAGEKGTAWTDMSGKPVPREWGSPVVRVRSVGNQ
jgi:hypothetical protein